MSILFFNVISVGCNGVLNTYVLVVSGGISILDIVSAVDFINTAVVKGFDFICSITLSKRFFISTDGGGAPAAPPTATTAAPAGSDISYKYRVL